MPNLRRYKSSSCRREADLDACLEDGYWIQVNGGVDIVFLEVVGHDAEPGFGRRTAVEMLSFVHPPETDKGRPPGYNPGASGWPTIL